MGLFDKFPYTNFHELNLDWLLKMIKELNSKLENFVALNTIKYANPIQWNITTQYEANTVVIDPNTGTAYISSKPVPSGVLLTNTDYWSVIFTLDILSANSNLTLRDDGSNTLATFASAAGDWLLWNGTLYKVSQAINVNEAYLVGYNITRYTIEQFIKDLADTTDTQLTAIRNTINNQRDIIDSQMVFTFNTITDLLSEDLPVNSFAQILNYSSGDGAKALFKISDTVTASDLYKTLNNGLYAVYQHLPYHNIKSFGIIDDANTDQSSLGTAILQWIDDCVLDGADCNVQINNTIVPTGDFIKIQNLNLYYNTDLHYYLTFLDKNYVEVNNVKIEKTDNAFTDYNRHLRFENCNTAIVKNSEFINYGTAVHGLTCNKFICDNLILNEACSNTDEHFGYGIDTSSAYNIITNIFTTNSSNTQGRHALYINNYTVVEAYVENFHVTNWHTMTFNLRCNGATGGHPVHITIANCDFTNAMDRTTGSGGSGLGGIINISSDCTDCTINIVDTIFKDCLYAGIANFATDADVNIHNCSYKCSNEANIMHRKNVISIGCNTHIDGFEIENFNDNYNQAIWVEGAFTVDVNNIYVKGTTSTMRMFAGPSNSGAIINLGSYETITPTVGTAQVTVNSMQYGNWSRDVSISNVVFFKQGKSVMMIFTGNVSMSTQTAASPAFVVPEGYRPIYPVSFIYNNVTFIIDDSGNCYPATAVTATDIAGTYTWLTV